MWYEDMLNEIISDMNRKELTREEKYTKIINWWNSCNRKSVEDYNMLLDDYKILFSCNSANIEGNEVSYELTDNIINNGVVKNYSGFVDDIIEIKNQMYAYNSIINNIIKKVPLSKELILKSHYLLLYGLYDTNRWDKGERPGEFKKNDYCVGSVESGSDPDDVEEDIEELINELNQDGDLLTKASYFHLQFESIHPFSDGNGRLGRLLLNYFLMLNNHPPIVIYNEDKEAYYMALEIWDRAGKLDGFKEFIIDETIKTWFSKIK